MRIVFCQCRQAGVIDASVVEKVEALLTSGGAAYEAVGDLCGLAAAADPRLAEWTAGDELVVLACRLRSVRSLFEAAGQGLPSTAAVIDLSKPDAMDAVASIQTNTVKGERKAIPHARPAWQPWFPVIDPQRCKNCKQCLNFCLFGVYGQDADGQVRVVRPDQCKTNCPACARVCPYAAIIFPKYKQAPINGEEVDEAAWRSREIPADLTRRLGKDVYGMLRQRSAGGADSIETLNSLKDELDIPDEVIDNLRGKPGGAS